MTLYLIGLGLSSEKDITLRGLEAVKRCKHIYLENYTSLLQCSVADLEKLYGKKIILADRNLSENKMQSILDQAKTEDVAFLVIGDPVSATTHINFIIETNKQNIKTEVIHNASILTAIGITGLQLYKFGKTTSIPFHETGQSAAYSAIKDNQNVNLHTLVLLDLDPKTDKFMTVNDAINILLKQEEQNKQNIFTKQTLVIGAARLGSESQIIKSGKAGEIAKLDFGKAPHALIVPSKLHFVEEEAVEMWK